MNKYIVILYKNGMCKKRFEVEASSFEEAYSKTKMSSNQQATIISQGMVRRFKGKQVDSNRVSMVKSQLLGMQTIFLNVGNLSESYAFHSEAERDAVYKECFMTLGFAAFANNEERLKDITVCLDAMYASKNILTEKKTSNGYATRATWKVKETPSSTENPFLKNNVADMDGNTWKDIYEKLHSKPESKILVYALDKMSTRGYPGWNRMMERNLHTCFLVSAHTSTGKTMWIDEDGWIWSEDVISVVTPVKVKNQCNGKFNQVTFVPEMVSGKVELAYKRKNDNMYRLVGSPYIYHPDWLEKAEENIDRQNLEVGRAEDSILVGREEGSDNREDSRRDTGHSTRPVVDRSEAPSIPAGVALGFHDASTGFANLWTPISTGRTAREGAEVRGLSGDSLAQNTDGTSTSDRIEGLTRRELDKLVHIILKNGGQENDTALPMQA